MLVVPAIDLRGGRCVRLLRGDYAQETVYGDDPVAMARRWQDAGAELLHVVDLDGALDGMPAQLEHIRAIVQALSIPVQVGGGVRTLAHGLALSEAGVQRIVLGTAAIEDPDLVDALLAELGGERVVVGVDARKGQVATRGWTETSAVSAVDLISSMQARGVQRVVYTDIDRDGTLDAPNYAELRRVGALGCAVTASGGVAAAEQFPRLAAIPGVDEAIVGRAIYTGDVVLGPGEWRIDTPDVPASGSHPDE